MSILITLQHSRTDEIRCIVSQLQVARRSPRALCLNQLTNNTCYPIGSAVFHVVGVQLNDGSKSEGFLFFVFLSVSRA
jgi:hypothetical protein